MLPVAQETIARYIQREIDALREYLENIPKDERNDHRRTIKEIERSIKKLEVKLKDCESAIMRDSSIRSPGKNWAWTRSMSTNVTSIRTSTARQK
jgi:DNA-binding transcriptional regulator GbsR (MarR family)